MRFLDKNNLSLREDWYGNNAAICCYACGKVFLVSQILHRKGRSCPQCGLTHALVKGAEVAIEENPAPETSANKA
ncbi:Zn finger protein HypA/HybF involved in hydrogenase expression [Granulicella aggregans]|uniref:Zn finger protein HypA/HybF involved in hydrogenase expression n=1 Tax=Granulicella aggregans TaxID=474949 RepID=A0A7W8E6C4_9BACT|nr:hypothetical protein [Granulicella aggregans]MBB5060526.1 Zn finger protein HypA/HybF involved in hydrogenase expression [Granulicella aggregans]